jgi:hypothetical protein
MHGHVKQVGLVAFDAWTCKPVGLVVFDAQTCKQVGLVAFDAQTCVYVSGLHLCHNQSFFSLIFMKLGFRVSSFVKGLNLLDGWSSEV